MSGCISFDEGRAELTEEERRTEKSQRALPFSRCASSVVSAQVSETAMVNPGAFQGSRLAFMHSEKPAYAAAVAGGYAADAVAQTCARYFRRYPVDLPHSEEPTEEFLANVDDNAPEPEEHAPDEDTLGEEAYAEAMAALEKRRALIVYRKGQIQRWLAYQFMKDNDLSARESGAFNPYQILLAHLTGQSTPKPRKKTAVNVWRPSKRTEIEAEKQRQISEAAASNNPISPAGYLSLTSKIANSLFAALSDEEKQFWEEKALDEHTHALAQWKADNFGPASTAPEDRQRVIQGLVRFMQQVLDLVLDASGWPCTFLGGGPEPADNGRLNIIHVHAGHTLGDVPMDFGRFARADFMKHILPTYSRFLHKTFTPEMCKARALSVADGHMSLSTLEDAFTESSGLEAASVPQPSTFNDTLDQRVQTALALLDQATGVRMPVDAPMDIDRAVSAGTSSTAVALSGASAPEASSSAPSSGHQIHVSTPRPASTPSLPSTPSPPSASAPRMTSDGFASAPPTPDPSPPASPAATPTQLPVAPSPVITPSEALHSVANSSIPPATTGQSKTRASRRKAITTPRGRETRLSAALAAAGASIALRSSKRVPKAGVAPSSKPSKATRKAPRSLAPPQAVRAQTPQLGHQQGPEVLVTTDPDFPDAPEWFFQARAMFDAPDLGKEWVSLVDAYLAFEKKYEYTGAARLKSVSRPAIISEWIRAHRPGPEKWDRTATIDNIMAFEEDFRAWWVILQPSWRVRDGQIVLDAMMGDWELLRRPGPNGLVLVLAGLCFWGSYLSHHSEDMVSFTDHVVDCAKILSHLL